MKIVTAITILLLLGGASAPLSFNPVVSWPGAPHAFPRLSKGECPHAYTLWSYRADRAPICVQEI